MNDIVELLTERRKLRYSGNCKCGKCCLVPHEMLCSAIDEIKRLRAARAEALEEAATVADRVYGKHVPTGPYAHMYDTPELESARDAATEIAKAIRALSPAVKD